MAKRPTHTTSCRSSSCTRTPSPSSVRGAIQGVFHAMYNATSYAKQPKTQHSCICEKLVWLLQNRPDPSRPCAITPEPLA
ncbi:unnamed protein product, partial [Clonostachys byssicola]